jgi:hypothetical protein
MRSVFAILVFAMVTPGLPSSALAQDGPGILVKGKPAKTEKKVCKTYDAPTGSRVGSSRVCRTPTEWKIAERGTELSIERQEQQFRSQKAQLDNDKNGLGGKGPH